MDFVRTLKALADPIRLRVLAALAEEELTVGEVQEVVESVQSSVSRNLAILAMPDSCKIGRRGPMSISLSDKTCPNRRPNFSSRCKHDWLNCPKPRGPGAARRVPAPSVTSVTRLF